MGTRREPPFLTESQRHLPEGLTLTGELVQAHVLGRAFTALDGRGVGEPVRRRVWCLAPIATANADWRNPFQQRLRTLLEESWPYVAAPREAGESDSVLFVVEEDPEGVLSSRLKTDAPAFDSRTCHDILQQLLTGLAALHRKGIAHGDLQPKHVILKDTAPSGGNGKTLSPMASLGGVSLGGLAWWSKGQFLDRDSAAFYPPKWKKEPHEPSFQADLYALGILAKQLTRGLAGSSPPSAELHGWFRGMVQRIGESIWATPADAMIRRLMQREFSDAQDALKAFRRLMSWSAWRRVILPGAVLLVLSVLAAWIAWVGWNNEFHDGRSLAEQAKNLQGEIETAKAKQREVEQERARDKSELFRLDESLKLAQAEIERLKPKPTAVPTPDPLVEARKIWSEIWDATDVADDEKKLEATKARYENLLKDKQNSAIAKHVADWTKYTKRLHSDARPWFQSEREMSERFTKASRQPWDESIVGQAKDFCDDLKQAGDKWAEWTRNSGLSYSDLDDLIKGESEDVQRILNRWRAATSERRSWTIRFTRGAAPVGSGTYRGIHVLAGNNAAQSLWHDWEKETQQDYSGKEEADKTLTFDWKPGDPLKVTMDGPRGYSIYRFEMFSQTISGPLAIWQAHKQGEAQGNKCTLQFEIVNCPGPPRDLYKPAPKP